MDNTNKFADELDTRMWKTKGSRYNKYRRYKRKHQLSLSAISILTLYVFIISLAYYYPVIKLSESQKELIPFLSIILSISILILSLLEASKNYQLKSERLYNCANEITNLYIELRQHICSDSQNQDEILSEIAKRYKTILEKYPENHDPIDYEKFQAEHSRHFNIGWIKKNSIFLKALILSYWLHLILICLPPIVFYLFVIKDKIT
jgi:hypothetical protein